MNCVPVREQHVLEILWPVHSKRANYRSGASAYLSHLLGHEADGSLFALIKVLGGSQWAIVSHLVDAMVLHWIVSKLLVWWLVGWANSLSAGQLNESFDFAFFNIHIALTEAGQGAPPSPRTYVAIIQLSDTCCKLFLSKCMIWKLTFLYLQIQAFIVKDWIVMCEAWIRLVVCQYAICHGGLTSYFIMEVLWVWMSLFSEHMKEIVSLTFQYIRFLQLHGIVPWLYEEVKCLSTVLNRSDVA